MTKQTRWGALNILLMTFLGINTSSTAWGQEYGAPPPSQQYGPSPMPQQYGAAPPSQQYGEAPQSQQYGEAPPSQQYGAPPPQQYGAPPPQQYGPTQMPQQYGAAPPQERGVDPTADALLRRMSEYLGNLDNLGVTADSTTEVVLSSGQKLQFPARSQVFVQRPNHLRSDRKGAKTDISFYYDGKDITLFGHRTGYYAVIPAPRDMDDMIDFVRARLDLDVPAADLLNSDPYQILMEDVVSGTYLGLEQIGGIPCHHLAYRGNATDWEIWIQDGPRPLPYRYVITSKREMSAPQFTVDLHDWNVNPQFSAGTFRFQPPPGAERIDFLGFRRSDYGGSYERGTQ